MVLVIFVLVLVLILVLRVRLHLHLFRSRLLSTYHKPAVWMTPTHTTRYWFITHHDRSVAEAVALTL